MKVKEEKYYNEPQDCKSSVADIDQLKNQYGYSYNSTTKIYYKN